MADIKLLLCHGTRDSINGILTDFAAVLSGQETSDEERQKLKEQSNQLLEEVSKVKRFKEESCEPRAKSARKCGPASSHLEISYELKREILNLIQKNLDYSIELFDDVSEEAKQALINDNANLIVRLKELKYVSPRVSILPEKTLSGCSTRSKDNGSHTPNQVLDQTLHQTSSSSSSQTLSQNSIKPQSQASPSAAAVEKNDRSIIEELRKEFDSKLKRGLDERALLLDELFKQELDKRMAEMDKKLSGQRKLISELNVNTSEKVFTFNLPNIRAFFSDTTKRFSEFFFCYSFKWSLLAHHVKKRGQVSDRTKFLQLHLFREDGLDEDKHEGQTINWICNTSFEIRILSQSSKVSDKIEKFDYVYVQPSEYASFGETEFISYQQLQSGYIKPDDSIDIRCHLKVNSFKRY